MKLIRIFTVCVVALALLTTGVCAAEFVPSISGQDVPKLEEGDDLVITPSDDIQDKDVPDETKESLEDAEEELKNNELEDLIPGFEDIWNEMTGGAPVDNAVVTDLFDVRYTDPKRGPDGEITFKISVDGITADDLFLIFYKPQGSDEWKLADFSIDENNVITIHADSIGTFIIVMDNGAVPVVEVLSPQTGVNASAMVFSVVGLVVLGAFGVICFKKLRKTTAQ